MLTWSIDDVQDDSKLRANCSVPFRVSGNKVVGSNYPHESYVWNIDGKPSANPWPTILLPTFLSVWVALVCLETSSIEYNQEDKTLCMGARYCTNVARILTLYIKSYGKIYLLYSSILSVGRTMAEVLPCIAIFSVLPIPGLDSCSLCYSYAISNDRPASWPLERNDITRRIS